MIKLLLAACLIFLSGCSSDRIALLEKQNQELTAKLEVMSKQTSLDLQEKCSKQAALFFRSGGWEKDDDTANFTNHCSAKVGKYFMEIVSSGDYPKKSRSPQTFRHVFDAFENKSFAEYFWINDKGKKYWEVAPFQCEVTTLEGQKIYCKSTEEYEELIKQFMEQ